MDQERLNAIINESQTEVERRRAYQGELTALAEPIYELETELDQTLTFYRQLWMLSREHGSISDNRLLVNLAKVESNTPGEQDAEDSSVDGVMSVAIRIFIKKGDQWLPPYSTSDVENINPNKIAFTFQFIFTPESQDAIVLRSEGEEASYWSPVEYDHKNQFRYKFLTTSHAGIAEPPDINDTNPEAQEELQVYQERYLPVRSQQVRELTKTRKLVQQALENHELNSWYEKILERERQKKELRRREEEQRQNQLLASARAEAADAALPTEGIVKRRAFIFPRRHKAQ